MHSHQYLSDNQCPHILSHKRSDKSHFYFYKQHHSCKALTANTRLHLRGIVCQYNQPNIDRQSPNSLGKAYIWLHADILHINITKLAFKSNINEINISFNAEELITYLLGEQGSSLSWQSVPVQGSMHTHLQPFTRSMQEPP